MVRLTMPDLLQMDTAEGVAVIGRLVVSSRQPADPFDGCGDFEVQPLAFELMQERRIARAFMAQVELCDRALTNVVSIFDRPLTKLPKKDLILLIRAAQDALADAKEQMG